MFERIFKSNKRKKIHNLLEKFQFVNPITVENFLDLDFLVLQAPAWGISTPPMSLAVLSAIGNTNNFKTTALDLNVEFFNKRKDKYKNVWDIDVSNWFWSSKGHVEQFIEDHQDYFKVLTDLICEAAPKCVGFSVYNSSFDCSILLASMIAKKNKNIKIIFGGPHVSQNLAGEWALERCPDIDLIVEGEGEESLIEVLSKIKTNKPFLDTPGTFYRDKQTKKLIVNPIRPSIRKLDDLPYCDYSFCDFSNYTEGFKLPIMSSRGCPNKCIYCTEMVYWKTYRSFSAERIYSEIVYQFKKYPHLNFVDFQDSLINGNLKHLKNLADYIIKGNVKFTWAAQAVIRREMDHTLFLKLKKSGCICLAFGMETTSLDLMKKVGKNLARMTDLENLVKGAYMAGLKCTFNFMFGLPGETEEHHHETMSFIQKNGKFIDSVNPSPAFCGFSRGTAGGDYPEKFNMIPDQSGNNYWESTDGENTYLVRLKRFEEFCALINGMNIKSTYPWPKLLSREKSLGDYFFHHKNYSKSKFHYENWLNENPEDHVTKLKYNEVVEYITSS